MSLLALYPATAEAFQGPAAALGNLLSGVDISTTTPGNYSTQARDAFVAGGFTVHFPTNNFQLINITPPSFSAGCGGISMFFGGLSFISGAQFSALVQNLMQAVLGYAVELAIQTLCPACEAVLQVLQKAAQLANALANNTCRLAKAIVNGGAGMLGLPQLDTTSGATQQCGKTTASTGNGSGFLSSLNSGVCQFATAANKELNSINTSLSGGAQSADSNKLKDRLGNLTYNALVAMGVTDKESQEILLSLVGTQINLPGSPPGQPYQPLDMNLDGRNLNPLVYAWMCGTGPLSANTALSKVPGGQTACAALGGGGMGNMELQNAELYVCTGEDTAFQGASDGICSIMTVEPMSTVLPTWSSMDTSGFIATVGATLNMAVTDVANGQSIAQNDPNAIALIQEVPFPLYQVINLAAVYPDIASELIANAALTISYMLTEKMLLQIMQDLQQADTAPKRVIGIQRILRVAEGIRTNTYAINQRILVTNNLELQMMGEVRQVNRLVQNQVMQEGLMGNQAFATGLMSNITLATPGSKA
ncbi:conjugal transfer protein TraH [Thiomonas sp.]